MQKIEQLSEKFGNSEQFSFSQAGDVVVIDIHNNHAKARISTYAGQVLSYLPKEQTEDFLFLSEHAIFKKGEAIRGGVPVCWPWFGDELADLDHPSHGFARSQQWTLLRCETLTEGSTCIGLLLTDTEETRAIWPYKFELYLEVKVGKDLTISLTTKNTDVKEFSYTQALHTYFSVSDVTNSKITGLENKHYFDKLDNSNLKIQENTVDIDKELDRIYQAPPETVQLVDSEFNRTINILSTGNNATVVWNPWSETVTKIKDLDDESYRKFVCVEAASTNNDVTIAPQQQHCIRAIYNVRSLRLPTI